MRFKEAVWWKKALIILAVVVLILAIAAGSMGIAVAVFRHNFYVPLPDTIDLGADSDEVRPLRAVGRGIYDRQGNRVALEGVNFGNWFIQEGWLSVNSLGAKYDKKGRFASVTDQGIVEEYEETYQDEVLAALEQNPNLQPGQAEQLWQVYYDHYITEVDFANVRELGANTIRLPLHYRTLMEGDDEHLVMRPDAFVRLDWFLEMCRKYQLYAILDLHGVVGGQSGYEHSGTRRCEFWTNETYIQEMCQLWENIARHYMEERPDLAETIAAYDLVNEPVDRKAVSTTGKQCGVLNRLYQAVRKVDDKHIVSIECCWNFAAFPSPAKYGWENVMYQIHLYNWSPDVMPQSLFYWGQDIPFTFRHFDVPYYIGEFTFFDDLDDWDKWLDEYDRRGFNWTIWTYKINSVGWWDNSWGVYVNRMNLQNEQLKLDLRTATYQQIYDEWSTLGTTERSYETGVLYTALKNHFDKSHRA